jgi:L-asparagine oxygenase
MIAECPSSWRDIATELRSSGYVFIPKWYPNRATIDIAHSIGQVVDIYKLRPQSNIPTVQVLRPRSSSRSSRNHYSGTFGFAEFPLHTDLAHWAWPPQYFVLRCLVGSLDVVTRILPFSAVLSTLGQSSLQRAFVRPRHTRQGMNCLLPLMFPAGAGTGFRWDSLFVVPMSDVAFRVAEVMAANAWDHSLLVEVALSSPGDTLIINNWRVLHGRSNVADTGTDRHLQRAYLSDLYT